MYFSGNLSDESTDPGDQNPLENHQNEPETAKKDKKLENPEIKPDKSEINDDSLKEKEKKLKKVEILCDSKIKHHFCYYCDEPNTYIWRYESLFLNCYDQRLQSISYISQFLGHNWPKIALEIRPQKPQTLDASKTK